MSFANPEIPKQGVYLSRSGKFKVFYIDDKGKWKLDEGIVKNHPIFRMKVELEKEMSPGWPLMETDLKNCVYLGEL